MDRLVPGFVLSFAGGIAAARGLPPAGTLAVLLGLAGAAFAVSRLPRARARLPPPWDSRASPSLLVLAALCGAARAGVDALPPGPADLERLLPARPVPVAVEGTARSAAEPRERAPKEGGPDPGTAQTMH